MKQLRYACLAACALLSACSGGNEQDELGDDPFPLADGNRWEMHFLDSRHSDGPVTTIVSGPVNVGGKPGYAVSDASGHLDDTSPSLPNAYFIRTPTEVTRVPASTESGLELRTGPRVILRLPLHVGDRWTQVDKTVDSDTDFDFDGIVEPVAILATVSVDAIETVSVGAGRFENAYRVGTSQTRTILFTSDSSTSTESSTTYEWYVPGIGLVRRETAVTPEDGPFTYQSSESLSAYRLK